MEENIVDEIRKSIERKKMELELCGNVRGLTVCVDDEILVRVGRYYYSGKVINISKLSIVMLNSTSEVAIAIGKISVVEIIRRGRVYENTRKA